MNKKNKDYIKSSSKDFSRALDEIPSNIKKTNASGKIADLLSNSQKKNLFMKAGVNKTYENKNRSSSNSLKKAIPSKIIDSLLNY